MEKLAWMAWLVVGVLVVICRDLVSAQSGCENIEVVNSYNYDGTYVNTGDLCTDRYRYKHTTRNYWLYYINGYWVIHDMLCWNSGHELGYARAKDPASYPEYIVQDWEIRAASEWFYNFNMYLNCQDDDGDELSGGAIVGIALGCVVGSFLLVSILVGCVKAGVKRHNRRHQSRESRGRDHSQPACATTESAYPRPVNPYNPSGYINPEFSLSQDYAPPDINSIGVPDLPSYEEAVRAHNKHYGTDILGLPPPYEQDANTPQLTTAGNAHTEIDGDTGEYTQIGTTPEIHVEIVTESERCDAEQQPDLITDPEQTADPRSTDSAYEEITLNSSNPVDCGVTNVVDSGLTNNLSLHDDGSSPMIQGSLHAVDAAAGHSETGPGMSGSPLGGDTSTAL